MKYTSNTVSRIWHKNSPLEFCDSVNKNERSTEKMQETYLQRSKAEDQNPYNLMTEEGFGVPGISC